MPVPRESKVALQHCSRAAPSQVLTKLNQKSWRQVHTSPLRFVLRRLVVRVGASVRGERWTRQRGCWSRSGGAGNKGGDKDDDGEEQQQERVVAYV